MSGRTTTVPTFAGWYPDPDTGGTKYWDGSRWTGDTRPPRRPFAAEAREDVGWLVVMSGACFVLLIIMGVFEGEITPIAALASVPLICVAAGGIGAYLLRGQGPTTQDVEARLAEEHKAAQKKRRAANFASFATRLVGVRPSAAPAGGDMAEAARVNALADPETARALQNLQNLVYTRTITDKEYQAAKDKLLPAQSFTASLAQIEKLAELHRAGILGDVEFAAAKRRALGLS